MRSPPSTLSRRKAPPSGRSFANADTGVSRSARRSRTSGTSPRTAFPVVTTVVMASLPPKQKPSPAHGTRARGATRSWPAIAGRPSASAVTERPLITEGFRAPVLVFRDAVSRDPFAPLPPPGLPPVPGSLSVFRGLIAPARATFAYNCSTGVGRRLGRGPDPAFGLKRPPLDLKREISTWRRAARRTHGGSFEASDAHRRGDPRGPRRPADRDRLPRHGQAPPLP